MGLLQGSRQRLYYWKQKAVKPSIHSKGWGGRRYVKYTEEQEALISDVICKQMVSQPCSTIKDYLAVLNDHNFVVGRTWLARLFKSWRWSWKKPLFQQPVSSAPLPPPPYPY